MWVQRQGAAGERLTRGREARAGVVARCQARASGRRARASASGQSRDATGRVADGRAAVKGVAGVRAEREQERGGSGRMRFGGKRAHDAAAAGGKQRRPGQGVCEEKD
jgi:hypothetical protein